MTRAESNTKSAAVAASNAALKAVFVVSVSACGLLLSGCKNQSCPGGYEGERRTVLYPPCSNSSCEVATACSALGGADVGYACMYTFYI
jgi:hypothetical protein